MTSGAGAWRTQPSDLPPTDTSCLSLQYGSFHADPVPASPVQLGGPEQHSTIIRLREMILAWVDTILPQGKRLVCVCVCVCVCAPTYLLVFVSVALSCPSLSEPSPSSPFNVHVHPACVPDQVVEGTPSYRSFLTFSLERGVRSWARHYPLMTQRTQRGVRVDV